MLKKLNLSFEEINQLRVQDLIGIIDFELDSYNLDEEKRHRLNN